MPYAPYPMPSLNEESFILTDLLSNYLVIATEYKDSLNGEIVDFQGKVTNELKVEAVTGSARILVASQI
jgi:hypothetical protein